MTYDEPMTTSLLRALHAAADVCRRCEDRMRVPAHPDADFVRKWLKELGDAISNAASDASNKRTTFDAVVDGESRIPFDEIGDRADRLALAGGGGTRTGRSRRDLGFERLALGHRRLRRLASRRRPGAAGFTLEAGGDRTADRADRRPAALAYLIS